MKAAIIAWLDTDPGANDNEFVARGDVRFLGTGVPGGVLNDLGPEGNGLGVPVNINQLAQFANNVEDALIARAVVLGLPVLARTDCLWINFTRGA